MLAEEMQKIASACVVECVRQEVEIQDLGNLILGYSYALQCLGEPPRKPMIRALARWVDPHGASGGFRDTPVTFRNGSSGLNARLIDRAMSQLDDAIDALHKTKGMVDPKMTMEAIDEIVHEFLKIHPFRDGNGRCAFIIHNWLSGTLHDPHPLPDYEF